MSFFAWLFGKRAEPATTIRPQERPSPPAASAGTRRPAKADEAENLWRWRDSGQARAWVEARGGCWDHDDWLALLEDLKRSPYWPMRPDAVGLALEEVKHEWLQRN